MEHPFGVGQKYRNAIGEYTVLSIASSTMQVRYRDGSGATVSIDTQARIWERIHREQPEAKVEPQTSVRPRRTSTNLHGTREVSVQGQLRAREHLSLLGFQILPSTVRGVTFHTALSSRSIPIRVRSIAEGMWQFTASDYMEIDVSSDGVQTVLRRKHPANADLVCVMVKLDEDAFFVLTWGDLHGVICTSHERWLADHGGRRPRKPESLHCGVNREDLSPWENNWDLVRRRLTT
jgi:hypothetical protein